MASVKVSKVVPIRSSSKVLKTRFFTVKSRCFCFRCGEGNRDIANRIVLWRPGRRIGYK